MNSLRHFLVSNFSKLWKNQYYNAFVSPLKRKMTFVLDDELSNKGAIGFNHGKNLRS